MTLGVRAGELSDAEATAVPAIVTQVCATGHGTQGNSVDPSVPSLAGQVEPYLERQLAAFKTQRRNDAPA